jgi:hypothetical protein
LSTKRHLCILSALLILLSLSIFYYKISVLNMPTHPEGISKVWNIEAKINVLANNKPLKVSFSLPPDQPHFVRLNEHFVSRNYGSSISNLNDNREATLSIRRASDPQTIYYRAEFFYNENYEGPPLPDQPRTPRPNFTGAQRTAAETLINNVRETSADSLSFATGVVKSLLDTQDGNVATLLDHNYSTENLARTAVDLLKGPSAEVGPNISSRLVYGFKLNDEAQRRSDIPLHIYLAIWDNTKKKWFYLDPETASPHLPLDFLIWQYGDAPLVGVEGGSAPNITFSFSQRFQDTLQVAQEAARAQRSHLNEFSLYSLPLKTQEVYQILIMLPLGALVILLLRSFIGLKTFGTFMPVLIAIALRETDLVSGLFLFTFIVGLGLSVRFYLERLKLLMIPRLTVVLSTVVLCMILFSIITYKLGLQHGLSIALFPMVIITMIIERMSVVWEERNPLEAIKQALGSLIAAVLAYAVMGYPVFEHLLFVFPELMILLMVAMLWLGQYHGYRLSELVRFEHI